MSDLAFSHPSQTRRGFCSPIQRPQADRRLLGPCPWALGRWCVLVACLAWFGQVALAQNDGSPTADLFTLLPSSVDPDGALEPGLPATGIVGVDSGFALPVLRPPLTPSTRLLVAQPEWMPEGASARFPVVSGDGFYVRLEPTPVNALGVDAIAEQVVDPILRAFGFSFAVDALAWPTDGVALEPLDIPALFADVATEEGELDGFSEIDLELLDTLTQVEPVADVALTDAALSAALGLSLEQLRQELHGDGWVYTFLQTVDGVPIERAGVHVQRRQGWSVDAVSGSLWQSYRVANLVSMAEPEVGEVEIALAALDVEPPVQVDGFLDEPVHILLPHGIDPVDGETLLRHAWRSTVQLNYQEELGPALVYLDAENGSLLAFKSWIGHAVPATGKVYRRAPDVGPVGADFMVDAATAGEYVLQGPGILRVDMYADNIFTGEVAIPQIGGGSSTTLANFDQAPLNDATNIACNIPGPNRGFEEVNLYQALYRNREVALVYGIWQPFPQIPWQPRVSFQNTGMPICNAYSSMLFEACQGFVKPNCPNFANAFINHAHDRTVISHEVAHHAVPRLTEARPGNWCGSASCPLPEGWDIFHDLADFWAGHVENTNCIGGWTAKNFIGGTNGSFNCSPSSDEGGFLPRLFDVATAFDPLDPTDHFPEHHDLFAADYAFGQVAAAALWQSRVGMRSRNRVAGHTLFWSRFIRALRFSGFANFSAAAGSDRYLYELLYDLESQMMDEWTFSAQMGTTSNKVQSGFARTGLFLIPPACLDNDAQTADARYCPGGENGGAAVIDIDDNVPADDLTLDGVLHRETDYLEIGGVAPSFDVWTGPRWQFTGTTARPVVDPPKCNKQYWVEVSRHPSYLSGPSLHSFWQTVDTDVTTPSSPECYARWTPSASQWSTFTAGVAPGDRIYYRVFTIDGGGSNLMSSDQPGKALWRPPSPYAVMTTDGRFARFQKALGVSPSGGAGN